VKAAIYTSSNTLIASTEEKTVSQTGWVTFNFADPKPVLTGSASYVLTAWSNSIGGVNMYYHTGSSNEGHLFSQTYGTWPNSPSFSHSNREYSIYCTYQITTQHTCAVTFSGPSNLNNWNSLLWTINGASSLQGLTLTCQLYNYQTGQFQTSGEGYFTGNIGTSDVTLGQIISVNPANFRDSIGRWQLKITAINSTSLPFTLSLDLARYRTGVATYALNLEEQWINLNYTAPHPALCIKTGALGSENLLVDVLHGGSWVNVFSGLVSNAWNNVSIGPYVDSALFNVRFRGGDGSGDVVQDSWAIDAALIRPEYDQELFTSLQSSTATVAVQLLQNGTLTWLGQNLQLTTQTIPVPPLPVNSIHVNETVNGINQEVARWFVPKMVKNGYKSDFAY